MIFPVLQIIAALCLDQLLGDPRWLPHPVRLIGGLGGLLERWLRRTPLPLRLSGVLTLAVMLGASGGAVFLLLYWAGRIHVLLGGALAVFVLYTTLAAKDLCRHSRAVYEALAEGDLEAAREKVGLIVGRETSHLSEQEVSRAAVESVAESLVDGVCAPLVYAFAGGPVGAILYKAVNTADSMFGYRNERYREFGWAAARLDDLANYVPARLTALIVPLAAIIIRLDAQSSWQILRRDRLNHASPNSGHTEAAMAGALGIRLGGTSVYFGQRVEKPTIGDPGSVPAAHHILLANRLMLATTGLLTLIFALTFCLTGILI